MSFELNSNFAIYKRQLNDICAFRFAFALDSMFAEFTVHRISYFKLFLSLKCLFLHRIQFVHFMIIFVVQCESLPFCLHWIRIRITILVCINSLAVSIVPLFIWKAWNPPESRVAYNYCAFKMTLPFCHIYHCELWSIMPNSLLF